MSGMVLIYGCGGGIGSFVASSLAQNGHGLHFTGCDEHKLKAVTEMSKSLTEATSIVDLGSFRKAGVAMIFSAGGGIGGALVQAPHGVVTK